MVSVPDTLNDGITHQRWGRPPNVSISAFTVQHDHIWMILEKQHACGEHSSPEGIAKKTITGHKTGCLIFKSFVTNASDAYKWVKSWLIFNV